MTFGEESNVVEDTPEQVQTPEEPADAHTVGTRRRKKNGKDVAEISEHQPEEENAKEGSDDDQAMQAVDTTPVADTTGGKTVVTLIQQQVPPKLKQLEEFRQHEEQSYNQIMKMYEDLRNMLLQGGFPVDSSSKTQPEVPRDPRPTKTKTIVIGAGPSETYASRVTNRIPEEDKAMFTKREFQEMIHQQL